MKKKKIKIFKILVKKGSNCWFISHFNLSNKYFQLDSFNPCIINNINDAKSIVQIIRSLDFFKFMDIFIISDYVKVSD